MADVLLVEDEEACRHIAGIILARVLNHRLVSVPDGMAAIAALEGGRFDLAVIDLVMPGLDGLSLAAQIRARRPQIRLLALTARVDYAARALASGFDGVCTKPFTIPELTAAVQRLLGARSVPALPQRADASG